MEKAKKIAKIATKTVFYGALSYVALNCLIVVGGVLFFM